VKPYYEEAGIQIFHGDCRDFMPSITASILITDPPYGTDGGNGYGRRQNHHPEGKFGARIANDLDTSMRDEVIGAWNGPMAVFASPRLAEPPGVWADRLVWDKKRPGMNAGPWRYRHELIFIAGVWRRTSDCAVSIFEQFPDQLDHPHAKPLSIMLALVDAAPTGSIIDPFMGSGTTLVAAKDLGRRAFGVDIEEKYCEIAANRLRQSVLNFEGVA
jgi:site-specific DNA-methyltransferase (adenine-specific)